MGLCCSSEKPVGKLAGANCRHCFQQPIYPHGSTVNGVRFFKLLPVEDAAQAETAASFMGPQAAANSSRADSHHEWLGKEFAQSCDELEFYDMACQLRDDDEDGKWRVFNFLPSFHGILRNAVLEFPGSGDGEVRRRAADLMVFRSPLEGLLRPRLLSLNVGPQSNALQFRRTNDLDSVLFARRHGISVEGMMAPPRSVLSEEPGFDAKGWAWGNADLQRAKRVELQSRGLGEVLTSFMDFRDTVIEEELQESMCPSGSLQEGPGGLSGLNVIFLGAAEFSELALHAALHQLASLLHASMDVPVPQKWVGSTVALIAEAGVAPPRLGPVDPKFWVASRMRVRLLGWNRSQVTSPVSRVSPEESMDHQVMWQLYLDSLGSLLWEVSRLYLHAFCAEEWQTISIQVFESHPSSDATVLLGTAELTLGTRHREDRELWPLPLTPPADAAGGQASSPELLIKLNYVPFPHTSRLKGTWRLQISSARFLPAPNVADSPLAENGREVFVLATAQQRTSGGLVRRFSQRTVKDGNRREPCWYEELHFPTVEDGDEAAERLRSALGCGRPDESFAGDEAAGNPSDSIEDLVKHLLEPEHVSTEDLATVMAMRQMAFIMEVRAGWLDAIPPVFPPPT